MVLWIKNWVTTICVAVIFITAVELILPSDKFKKYVQFVMGIILIAVIINPIVKLVNSNEDVSSYISQASKYINNSVVETNVENYKKNNKEDTMNTFKLNIEDACTKMLKEKFPYSEYKVTAKVNYDKDTNEIDIMSLNVGVKDNKIVNINKVQIGDSSVSADANKEVGSSTSVEIKKYLNDQLKLSKEKIQVYKM